MDFYIDSLYIPGNIGVSRRLNSILFPGFLCDLAPVPIFGYFSLIPIGIRISYCINIWAVMSLISFAAKNRPGLCAYIH